MDDQWITLCALGSIVVE